MSSPEDPDRGAETNSKQEKETKKPEYNAFRQQRIKAWQPILTPKSVLPLFFIVGVVFAPIGGALLYASAQVQELIIDYSTCGTDAPIAPQWEALNSSQYSSAFKKSSMPAPYWQRNIDGPYPVCRLYFDIPQSMGPPVLMYYQLTNFYQNHRRYSQSLSIDQLKGEALSNQSISKSTCDPLRLDPETGKAYYPCGLIANSMFNDTINSPVRINDDKTTEEYTMTNKGIAWASDLELIKPTKYQLGQVHPPPNWHDRFPNGYTEENPIPNLQEDEDFMVWMRTAGLPNFSKMSRRNDTVALQPGYYYLDIVQRFPVTEYKGTKSIFISTRTVMGGRNSFMGIAYVVIGGLCCLIGLLFTVAYFVRPRKLGDHTYLSWNTEPEPSAVTTGRDQGGRH